MEIEDKFEEHASYPDKTIYIADGGKWELEIYDDGEVLLSCNAEFTDTLVTSREELRLLLEANNDD